jgi:putative ABC transport system substrate-binding protein
MRRREFIKIFAGSAAAWPLSARAQQPERVRRIGVLMPFAKDNPEGLARIAAFVKELQRLGWTDGRNIQIEYRWDTGDLRKAAMELVTLSPDVILASATPAVAALQQVSQTVLQRTCPLSGVKRTSRFLCQHQREQPWARSNCLRLR